ncbi:MAG: sugar ABC transporter ATP-binding protein [Isosphaeraceae bacterium]
MKTSGISRRFAAVQALNSVDLELHGGEIHALCGENGAGKSTLIQILGGVFRPDSGRIEIGGREVRFRDPADALAQGIAIIYQELNLVEPLTVAENLSLGHEPRVGPWIDRRAMNRRARNLLADLRFDLDPRAPVAELTIGQRQQVEIAKALGRRVRVLVLDEPTAALSRAEADRLFEILNQLCTRGLAVLFVSHHLEEVFAIAHRITVLRDGRRVGTWPRAEQTLTGVVARMVGEAVDIRERPPRKVTTPSLLEVTGADGRTFRDVGLQVRPGEVVGLCGLAGSGHEELSAALFGASPLSRGTVTWKGRTFRPRHPDDARAAGIAYVPPDRRRQGLVPPQGITENLTLASLGSLATAGWINQKARRGLAESWCQRFEVAASRLSQRITTLSGGNQQKVLLARWAARDPDLFLLNEPTRGIDVKTREAIHRWVESLAETGRCVLLVSSDTQELIRLADRCLVFRSGRIVRHLEPPNLDEHTLIAAMMEGEEPNHNEHKEHEGKTRAGSD